MLRNQRRKIVLNKKQVLSSREKKLIRRYLIWYYKTTKEDLDRIDRYYTQYLVDNFIFKELKSFKEFKKASPVSSFRNLTLKFEEYKNTKKENADQKKFTDAEKKILNPDYLYLASRLKAIEKAVIYFLGKMELANIKRLYEEEMIRRIIQAAEHT